MFKRLRKNKKAQNTAEYAILISLVVAAIIAMQVYVQRGMQGRIHDAVQTYLVGQTNGLGGGDTAQYEPYYLNSAYTVTRSEQESQGLGVRADGINIISSAQNSTRTRAIGGFQESTFCATGFGQNQ